MGSTAALLPNVPYKITIRPLNNISTSIIPESMHNVTFEFSAHIKSSLHHIQFRSEGEIIQSYILADGQAITSLPTPNPREGYQFQGWFLPNGMQLIEGYIVTSSDGDIIATARWTHESSNAVNFDWWIPLLILAIISGILIYWHHRRSASAVEPI